MFQRAPSKGPNPGQGQFVFLCSANDRGDRSISHSAEVIIVLTKTHS